MTRGEKLYYKAQLIKQLAWVNAQLDLPADDETIPDEPLTPIVDRVDTAMRNLGLAMDRMAVTVDRIETERKPHLEFELRAFNADDIKKLKATEGHSGWHVTAVMPTAEANALLANLAVSDGAS